MDLMKALTSQYMKQELPEVQVGDTVRVHVKIKEGSRERIQIFEGTVIAKKHGGIEETITVRRISYGVGCEKVFPLQSWGSRILAFAGRQISFPAARLPTAVVNVRKVLPPASSRAMRTEAFTADLP